MAGSAANEEVFDELLFPRISAFHFSEFLDHESQTRFYEGHVEAGPADSRGKSDAADFAQQASRESAAGAQSAFRQRKQVSRNSLRIERPCHSSIKSRAA